MLTFKKYTRQFVLLGLVFFAVGCDKMLELYPEDQVTRDSFWQNESNVESVMTAAYNKLQGCLNSFFVWGEVRGDLVNISKTDNASAQNRRRVNQHELTQENEYCDWGIVYQTINMLNLVIDFAPLVVERDETFTNDKKNQYIAEAKTMRALCYFYLARTFETFPYITQSAQSDEQNYIFPGSPGIQVLDSLVKDLTWAETIIRKNFNDIHFESSILKTMYDKGRAHQTTVWALLTDIYLTQNKYTEAVNYADKLINSGNFSLLSSGEWLQNFYPGNSSEGIFELQFSKMYQNSGDFVKWFSDQSSVGGETWYMLQRNFTTGTYTFWEGSERSNTVKNDVRGQGGTYPNPTLAATWQDCDFIWKWSGIKWNGTTASDRRNQDSNDPNWIFYRLADIYLMKAEALNRLGRSQEAINILKIIKLRAGLDEQIYFTDVKALEDRILDERAAELAFEGKRWFDMVRIARRQNDYLILSDRIGSAYYSSYRQGAVRAKLTDPLSWYMPIHRSELEKNPQLVQNKYYKVN